VHTAYFNTRSLQVQLELCRTRPHTAVTPQGSPPMINALIVVALAGVGAYLVSRVVRPAHPRRGIDVGAVSTSWIAEHRREEPR
ncbi:MAG: hypothetical protein ACRD26_19005, partial [Vicinamibacterales bacterium]